MLSAIVKRAIGTYSTAPISSETLEGTVVKYKHSEPSSRTESEDEEPKTPVQCYDIMTIDGLVKVAERSETPNAEVGDVVQFSYMLPRRFDLTRKSTNYYSGSKPRKEIRRRKLLADISVITFD